MDSPPPPGPTQTSRAPSPPSRPEPPPLSWNTLPDARPLRLAFAGGGTGGHIVPGLHLLADLPEGAVGDLLWFQTGRAVEDAVFTGAGPHPCERVVLPLEPRGGGAPRTVGLALRTPPAVRRARRLLKDHGTEVVLGLGGFTSLPVVLAARSLSIPVALLEVNAVEGRATRWLGSLCQRVLHAWEGSLPGRPGRRHRCIGAPVRHAFFAPQGGPDPLRTLGLDPARPLLLVLGGSQGARGLNAFVAQHAKRLVGGGLQVLHQRGPGREDEGLSPFSGYHPVDFLRGVDRYLAHATLVLCRGGASTLAEVAASATPAVVVPYPHHKDRHQLRNAEQLGEGARVVEERDLGSSLVQELLDLASEEGRARREAMSAALRRAVPEDATATLFSELLALRSGRA